MRNTPVLVNPPGDGGSAVVIEGLGLFACAPDSNYLNEIALHAITSINASVPTIIEISPQNYCDSNLQDWKGAFATLVANIEASSPNAGTWWGGFMLDEEPDFWLPGSAAAFEDLNGWTETLMASYAPGISWLYTESFFIGQETWNDSFKTYETVTGSSIPAPQAANLEMLLLIDQMWLDMGQSILMTWGLGPDYTYHSFVVPDSFIDAPPYHQWGFDLSNCFIGTICNDWDGDGVRNSSDADNDNDGCGNTLEPLLNPSIDPLNPWDFYSVPVPALYAAPNPTTDFKDSGVSYGDAQAVEGYFQHGAKTGTALYEQDLNQNGIKDGWEYDRSVVGSGRSGPPDGIVAATDAQLAFAQANDNYHC